MWTNVDDVSEKISRDLQNLGVRAGGVLLVHASFRSLGEVPGGIETVIQGLLKRLGEKGTLLMPALSYQYSGPDSPVFDVRDTPSCVGALPEYFRTRPGTLRSVHPTHSVCGIGDKSADLLRDHQLDHTPCGLHSPFSRLPLSGGQILFLGCGLRPNTSMHAIEEHIQPPYLFADMVHYQVFLQDGRETHMAVRSHNFKGFIQRYDRLAELLGQDSLRQGKVLKAQSWVVETDKMWWAALQALRQDPFYFVEAENT